MPVQTLIMDTISAREMRKCLLSGEVVSENRVWRGSIRRSSVWRGSVWRGSVWRGSVWRGSVWRGSVWRCSVWRGSVWRGRRYDYSPCKCIVNRPLVNSIEVCENIKR